MITNDLQKKIMTARKEWQAGDDRRDAGLPKTLAGVRRFDNLSYGPAGKWNLTDLYRPTDQKKVPVIVNIHGGGWFYGTKETYQFYGLALAQAGFGVVNFNYRLAPETSYPGAVEDVDLLLHWLVEQAANYQLDLNNVFLVGDSAGGQLAEQYLALYSNFIYRQLFGFAKPKLKIKAAALNCGVYFVLENDWNLDDLERAYFQPDLVEKYREQLKIENYLTDQLPPLFIATANQDFLHNKACQLDKWLTKQQIKHVFKVYGDFSQPRRHDFQINQKDTLAKRCNEDELTFFKRYVTK